MADRTLDNKWFADKFIEISNKLGGIEENQKTLFNKITNNKGTLKDHEHRLQCLEKFDAVQEERQNIIEKNPIKTGVAIGGVSIGTIVGVIAGVLKLAGII